MRIQDVVFSMFILILVFLLVRNWKGATAILTSSTNGVIGLTKALQGR